MYNVLTAREMREAERRVNAKGVDNMFLRFNAAMSAAREIAELANEKSAGIAVFCGTGGNGADGLIIAAILKRDGYDCTAYSVGDRQKFGQNLAPYTAYCATAGVSVKDSSEFFGDESIIVDAIFGIGLNRTVTDDIAVLINKLNALPNTLRIAIDIPSGLNADTGEILGACFKAHRTVTFSCYKRGMLFGSGRDVCGSVTVEDVGIETESNIRVFTDADVKPLRRRTSAHKGNFGKIYIIGGCGTMVGAPILAASAAHSAYLSGAGTVTLCIPESHRVAASSRAVMTMLKFMPDTPEGFIKFDAATLDEIIRKADVIDIGMGMGANPELNRIIKYICEKFSGCLIIDADGLNSIKGDYGFLSGSKAKIVLTPHVGEFRRLTGMDDSIENAVALAKSTGAVVVMKSATTVITDGTEVRLNVSGSPAMAKGGTGDLLAGCIAGLCCTLGTFDAASVACYRNGKGAEHAVSSYAELMLTPKDILKFADYKELD